MPREETIFIPWMGPSTNTFWSGVHYGKRSRIAKEGHVAVLAATHDVEPFTCPVSLTFKACHGKGSRRRDVSNYSATAKVVEDGLVLCAVIEKDSFRCVREITIKGPIRAEKTGMTVTIREVD